MVHRSLAAFLVLFLAIPTLGQSASPDDRYLAGYATAILERELQITATSLEVRDGVIFLDKRGLGRIERNKVRSVLSAIRGVKSVIFGDELAGESPASQPTTTVVNALRKPPAKPRDPDPYPTAVLAPARLFEPLIADPRWPHFFATYQHYFDNDQLESVGAVGFGETIAFLRQNLSKDRRIEIGVQAGVFAVFDLNAESKDLVNADYFVGPMVAYRDGDFSLLTRVYHQSSHVGDEFLLRGRLDEPRINLSYEVVDLLLSYDLPAGFRIYGGGGYIFHRYPDDLEPWLAQYGVEYQSPKTYFNGLVRPVAAVDCQHREQNDFDLDLSVRAGIQIEDPSRFSSKLQFLLEYYRGRSPNGQFFDERIESIGVGMHFFF
jgi:hypothetical protein